MPQSMQRPDSILASGRIAAASGLQIAPPVAGSMTCVDWTGAAPAVSVYTVTLGHNIDATERVVMATPHDVVDSTVSVTANTDATLQVSAGTAAGGVAGDRAFDFTILRVAG